MRLLISLWQSVTVGEEGLVCLPGREDRHLTLGVMMIAQYDTPGNIASLQKLQCAPGLFGLLISALFLVQALLIAYWGLGGGDFSLSFMIGCWKKVFFFIS